MKYIDRARQDFKANPSSVIAHVIMLSYCYYHRYASLVHDEDFDKMMLYIKTNYDKLQHKYKHLITKEDCEAGSLYALPLDKYPQGLVTIAEALMREHTVGENTL